MQYNVSEHVSVEIIIIKIQVYKSGRLTKTLSIMWPQCVGLWTICTNPCSFSRNRVFNWLKKPSTPPPPKGEWLGIFQPNWQNNKILISPTGKIGSTPNFDRVIEPHSWLCGWSRITKFLFKIADGCHIAKCWKRYNSPTSGPIGMKLWLAHPIVSPTCPPWCSCHGNSRCLATLHCTFSRHGRPEAERVNQLLNLVYNSKLMTVTWSNIKI